MPLDPDDILPAYDDDQDPVILVDGTTEVATLSDLIAAAPDLSDGANAALLARAANHLAHEHMFKVIEDPQDFRSWYLARLKAEDPDEEWDEDRFQLTAYPLPDLDQIAAPALSGGILVFFAVNTTLGTPYRVQIALNDPATPVDYVPLPAKAEAG